jgi:hypothetical protein
LGGGGSFGSETSEIRPVAVGVDGDERTGKFEPLEPQRDRGDLVGLRGDGLRD